MTPLTPELREKLAKVLALLGSSHAGERDAAALAANGIVKAAGVTWEDVIRCGPAPTISMRGIPPATMAQAILFSGHGLTASEMNFALRMASTTRRHRTVEAAEMERLVALYARACAGSR